MDSPRSSSVAPHTPPRRQSTPALSAQLDELPEAVVNPFTDGNGPLGIYEKIKLALGVVLVPVRLGCFLTVAGATVMTMKLATLGLKGRDFDQPLSPLRRRIVMSARTLFRLALLSAGFFYIKETGQPAPRSVAPIVVANHISIWDPLFLFFRLMPSIISRKENLNVPLNAPVLLGVQAILVDRASEASRAHTASEIARRAADNNFPPVAIFPEGTTTNGKALITFRTGAFQPGLPVQPCVFRYPAVNYNPCFTPGVTMPNLVLHTFTQFFNFMEVHWLPVYYPSEAEKKDPILYAHNVRRVMARALNVPTTAHSYDDIVLAMMAEKLNLPASTTGMIEVSSARLLDTTLQDLEDMVRSFSRYSTTGKIRLPDMARALGLPETDLLRKLFTRFDRKSSGEIDIREFLTGLIMISRESSATLAQQMDLIFRLFDTNGDGRVTAPELATAMRHAFPSLSDEKCRAIFEEADVDKSGWLDSKRLSSFLLTHPEYCWLVSRFVSEQAAANQSAGSSASSSSASSGPSTSVAMTSSSAAAASSSAASSAPALSAADAAAVVDASVARAVVAGSPAAPAAKHETENEK